MPLWSAAASPGLSLHQRLARLGSYLVLPRLGVLWRDRLVSGCNREGNGRTDRGKICRVDQNHSPVAILRDKLGSPVWLGKPPPYSLLFLPLLRPLALGSEVFPLLHGRRAEEKSEADQFCFWSLGGPERKLVDGLCFANVSEVSWLRIKLKKQNPSKQEKRLFKEEGKNPAGSCVSWGCTVAGPCFPVPQRWKCLCCAPSPCQRDAEQVCVGAGLAIEYSCRMPPEENPREKSCWLF